MSRVPHAAGIHSRQHGVFHESVSCETPADVAERQSRASQRFPHRLPCEVRVFDAQQREWVTRSARTVNISATGLAVQVGMVVPVGSRVETVIPRVDSEPLRVSGTVTRARRVLAGTFEIGIRAGAGAS